MLPRIAPFREAPSSFPESLWVRLLDDHVGVGTGNDARRETGLHQVHVRSRVGYDQERITWLRIDQTVDHDVRKLLPEDD